ncbi:hypothetical protein LINGRAHAP2_LOCUS29758 [Linum grandiflorum]
MILALGARGPEFDSLNAPNNFKKCSTILVPNFYSFLCDCVSLY